MGSALEKLGLTPADFGAAPPASAADPAPARPSGGSAGSALERLGLTPADFGQSPAAAAAPPDPQLGGLASGALGAAQGLTFGFSDELAGGVAGIGSALSGEGFGPGYRRGTDYVRGLHDQAQPGAFLAGDIAGSLLLPGGVARGGATLAAKAARGALSGAAQGAVGAAGRAEGGVADRAPEAAAGAALGGALGGAVGAALPAAGQGIRALARRAAPETVEEAGGAAIEAIRSAAARGRQGVNEAYDAVARLEGRIEGEGAFELLQQRLGRVLDEGGFNYVPGVGDEVGKVVERLVSDLGPSASLQRLEGARKGLNRAIGTLSHDPSRKAALTAIKGEFDGWMQDAITNGLYRGDPEAIEVLKTARGLNTEYQRLFGIGGRTTQDRAAGRIIEQMLDDNAGPAEVVNLLFGMSGIGIKASRAAVARIRDISPEALDQMKAAHFTKVLAPNGGEFDPGPTIAKRLQKLVANQPQMMKTLYGDDLRALNRFGAALGKGGGVAEKTARFVAGNPWLVRGGLAATGAVGATATGESPWVGALLGALGGARAGRGASSIGRIETAARRADQPLSGRIGQAALGRVGRLGGIAPSLAGGL